MDKNKLKQFGYVFGIIFPLLFGLIIPLYNGHDLKIWTIYIGFAFILTGLIKPMLLKHPYNAWMFLGLKLSKINSILILGFVFFLILFPISILMKLFRYDPLKKISYNLSSYKVKRSNVNIDFDKIF